MMWDARMHFVRNIIPSFPYRGASVKLIKIERRVT